MQQLEITVPPDYQKADNTQPEPLTYADICEAETLELIENHGLKPVLETLAAIVGEETVTLKPRQVDQIRSFLELAAEEID